MQWAALIAWLVTAGGGSVLALQWFRHGGPEQQAGIRTYRLLTHALLAAVGLALWITHIATGSQGCGWIAVAFLVAVAMIGVSMLALWFHGRSGTSATTLPAESSFPLPIIALHGLLAVLTLTLSVLALI
jgi:FtsH-binding integral membrane protein